MDRAAARERSEPRIAKRSSDAKQDATDAEANSKKTVEP